MALKLGHFLHISRVSSPQVSACESIWFLSLFQAEHGCFLMWWKWPERFSLCPDKDNQPSVNRNPTRTGRASRMDSSATNTVRDVTPHVSAHKGPFNPWNLLQVANVEPDRIIFSWNTSHKTQRPPEKNLKTFTFLMRTLHLAWAACRCSVVRKTRRVEGKNPLRWYVIFRMDS